MSWTIAEDTDFVAGDSPVVITVFSGSPHPYPIAKGYIACDGTGSILVEFAQRGSTYEDQITLKTDEALDFKDDIGLIRITHSGTDSAYRVVAVPVNQ